MATIDCTLDGFMIPALPTYSAEFGTKKSSGGLSTAECVDVTAMPFSRQRPFAVSETSSTTAVEAHSAFRITASGITLTLGDAAFEGCAARIVNAASGSATVAGTGFTGTIGSGTEAVLAWRGGEWAFESGDGYAENGAWHVWTAAGLLAWASACSSNMGAGCRMEASIDLTGVTWTPVGTSSNPYTGFFSGGGHCVSGMVINSTSSYQGFFGCVGSGGEVHDLHLDNTCSVKGADMTGGIAGRLYGTISHCSNAAAISGTGAVGGIAGGAGDETGAYSPAIAHCLNAGSVTASGGNYMYAGGIAGIATCALVADCVNEGDAESGSAAYTSCAAGIVGAGGSLAASSCSNKGSVKAGSGGSQSFAGGISGYAYGTSGLSSCSNGGDVTGPGHTGGVVGLGTGSVSNCSNGGTVTGSGAYTGGVAGNSTGSVSSCSNGGTVTGSGTYTGGVAGNSTGSVSSCSNGGTVSGTGTYTGGVAGYSSGGISSCRNSAAVSGSGTYTGGVAGYSTGQVSSSSNTSAVTGTGTYTGGIVGYSASSVSNCANSGAVSGSSTSSDEHAVGGIAGYLASCAANGCLNSGSVSFTGYGARAGGIAGWCYTGFVSSCANTGTVTSTHTGGSYNNYAGGICAVVGPLSGTYAGIACCVNSGTVTASGGTSYTGYMTGLLQEYSYGILQYNTRIAGPTSEYGRRTT